MQSKGKSNQTGLIVNQTKHTICYSIGQTRLVIAQHKQQVDAEGQAEVGYDGGPKAKGKVSAKKKITTKYVPQTQASIITVQKESFSTFGLKIEPKLTKYISVWIGSQEEIKEKLIKNLKIVSVQDIRLQILKNKQISNIQDSQMQELLKSQKAKQKNKNDNYQQEKQTAKKVQKNTNYKQEKQEMFASEFSSKEKFNNLQELNFKKLKLLGVYGSFGGYF